MNDGPVSISNERRIELGEITLHVTEFGANAEPLILLHGIGSRVHSWWPVVDQLAKQFRLIIPDQRGHGSSDKPESGYTIPSYSRDLDALIRFYGIEKPSIVGHSLGGMVALNWAARNPSRARRIVIEDSPMRRAEDVEGLFDGWIRLASMPVDEVIAHYKIQFPDWTEGEYRRRAVGITSTRIAVFEELKAQNLKPDVHDRIAVLSGIQTPTLLVYGDTSAGGMVPAEDATRFSETLPNATLAHITNGTHSLHRDRPNEFLAATLPFLMNDQG